MDKVAVLNLKQFGENGRHPGFYANTLENHLVTAHRDIIHPHSHDFYLALFFTGGSGIHEVDFTPYQVQPGALFLLNPGQTHHWSLSDDVSGYVFFHSQEFYDLEYTHRSLSYYPFFYSKHSSPNVNFCGEAIEYITSLFRQVLSESSSQEPLSRERLLNLADLVYIEAARETIRQAPLPEANHNHYYLRFRKLESLIEEHFREEKSPAAYAEMMHMTPKHLNRITQLVAGKPTGKIITDRVLLEAKKQLVLRKKTFNQIADWLGFSDYAYFSRLFKNHEGETPSSFLKKYEK